MTIYGTYRRVWKPRAPEARANKIPRFLDRKPPERGEIGAAENNVVGEFVNLRKTYFFLIHELCEIYGGANFHENTHDVNQHAT